MNCEYSEKGRACKEEATMQVRYGRREHPLCLEHGKPKYHPPDIRHTLTLLSPVVNETTGGES
jgi:hypothetical protein